MELRQLFLILRRWAWLLALGLVVGFIAGYLVSSRQEPTYSASTKLLVSSNLQGKTSEYAGLSSPQLLQTYIQLLKTNHLRDAASKKLGINILPNQISAQLVIDTQIIEIKVESRDPEQATQIANTLALILIEENTVTRTKQFSAQESTLSKQVEETKQKISTLQAEYDQASEQNYQAQLSQVNEQIASIQTELSTLQADIASLAKLNTVKAQAQLAEKKLQVTQLQNSFNNYDNMRANLLILGRPTQNTNAVDDPRLQQMRATITLYQNTYINLLTNLESMRQSRLQQTPNAMQIEEASIPVQPVRPLPLTSALLSGAVGFLLAVGVVFLLAFSKDTDQNEMAVVADSKRKK